MTMFYGIKHPRNFSNEFIVCAFGTKKALEAAGYERITRDQARKLCRPNRLKGYAIQDHRIYGNVACKTDENAIEELGFIIDEPDCIPLPKGAPRKLFLI
jgi:hypothetical protein